ncbi:putative leucine-rich repeat-containing protein DDB_G0290503 [Centruroides sculpturatus]|uniref:putative leucine-rich repeat-containing protein DDB_G0290503 n=1 Tax=Centruroides sculpturatus TaxID=218467 RepID=UPI000C6E4BE4|nr:putative leucine-rich repeat-containing protein DDB_G0290503 [Centruroides sculpturatus]XP_023242989.1 putative leucine-rich repeat-containing protein DDB_G0290503 [Centruroides sculpturatus]
MATSLMMAGIIRSQPKDLKKKSVRFALPENFLCLKDYNGENGNRNDDRNFWLSPISGAYYDWLQRNSGKSFPSHHPDPNIDIVNKGDFYNEDYLQLPGSPTESMQEIGSLASDATFTVSSTQKCSQCYKLEENINTLTKEKEELTVKLKKGEEEIKYLRNNVRKLEESHKEIENTNKATLQRVKFLENNLSQGQAEQAQLQVKLAESRAKLCMLLSGKECGPHKRSKSLEQKELEVEETKAQMDLLRSEVERLTISSSRVDVLSSTIQVYKDRIAQLQKYVETNMKKKRVDIAIQVGCKRMINRFSKDKTRIPFLVRCEQKDIGHNMEDNHKKENQSLINENKIYFEKDNLVFTLKQTINELEQEKDQLQQKLNQLQVQEKKSNEKINQKEQEIITLQQKNSILLESYRKEMVIIYYN